MSDIDNGEHWQPIETAPRDGTMVWTYTAAREGLSAFQGPCAYHPDAGWCTDELREVTHWVPLGAVYLEPPSITAELVRLRALRDAVGEYQAANAAYIAACADSEDGPPFAEAKAVAAARRALDAALKECAQ